MPTYSTYGGQIPLHYEIVGPDNKMNQQWAFWFQQFVSNLPPPGTGFVYNGDPQIVPTQTLFQGPDALKGS